MGQYYRPVNIDNMEWLHAHDYGSMLKLMEHSYVDAALMKIVEGLLSVNGKWHKGRIVWAGDYMDKDLYSREKRSHYVKETGPMSTEECERTLYDYVGVRGTRVFSGQVPDSDNLSYLINHSKNQYVDMSRLRCHQELSDWPIIHPLPLLTVTSNGRGGGDFDDSEDKYARYIGLWEGDMISMSNDKCSIKGCTEICPDFVEKRYKKLKEYKQEKGETKMKAHSLAAEEIYRAYCNSIGKGLTIYRDRAYYGIDRLLAKGISKSTIMGCIESYRVRIEKQRKYGARTYRHAPHLFFYREYAFYLPQKTRALISPKDKAALLIAEYNMTVRLDGATDDRPNETHALAKKAIEEYGYKTVRKAMYAYNEHAKSNDIRVQHTFGPRRFFKERYLYWVNEPYTEELPDVTLENIEDIVYPYSIEYEADGCYDIISHSEEDLLEENIDEDDSLEINSWIFVPEQGKHIGDVFPPSMSVDEVAKVMGKSYARAEWEKAQYPDPGIYIYTGRLINISSKEEYDVKIGATTQLIVKHDIKAQVTKR